jgi:septal ring factor EnvC (AmiA/AmiB activator)
MRFRFDTHRTSDRPPNSPHKFLLKCAAVLSAIAASGCATASSTTGMLAQQTEQNRALLRLEQDNTRQLVSQRASLQSRLASLSRRRDALTSSASPDTGELQRVNAEIAQLKKLIAEQ